MYKNCESCEKSYSANLQLCPHCKRINWIVQAWASLLGWVDCRTATTLESATQQAASLANKSDAWMSSTPLDSLARATRNEWVRIVPLEFSSLKSLRGRMLVSKRERSTRLKTCVHSYSGNDYFRGYSKTSQPGCTPSSYGSRFCVKCGFVPESSRTQVAL
jgi:RNA polymerase subunit RPABC4/transcription elongation factor Spt4